jgi:CobQ-like glutamine amidotransferase family enzyme
LVAALAWNELVKETIETYLKPYLPQNSKVASLLVYAVLVTVLAVVITLQLTKIQSALEQKEKQQLKNSKSQ